MAEVWARLPQFRPECRHFRPGCPQFRLDCPQFRTGFALPRMWYNSGFSVVILSISGCLEPDLQTPAGTRLGPVPQPAVPPSRFGCLHYRGGVEVGVFPGRTHTHRHTPPISPSALLWVLGQLQGLQSPQGVQPGRVVTLTLCWAKAPGERALQRNICIGKVRNGVPGKLSQLFCSQRLLF